VCTCTIVLRSSLVRPREPRANLQLCVWLFAWSHATGRFLGKWRSRSTVRRGARMYSWCKLRASRVTPAQCESTTDDAQLVTVRGKKDVCQLERGSCHSMFLLSAVMSLEMVVRQGLHLKPNEDGDASEEELW